MRKISISVFLSNKNEFVGGDLIINPGADDYYIPEQVKGWGVIFPSWMSHRVTAVTKGIRRSLVMWVYGPIFK